MAETLKEGVKEEVKKAKNLTNCNLREFTIQTRLIKHHLEKWLKETDIMNIRKNLPDIPDDIDDEKKQELLMDQGIKNVSAMLDAMLDDYPEDTITLIALLCFVPFDEIDVHPMTYYMQSITEMLRDKTVWDFFISLAVAARRIGITRD